MTQRRQRPWKWRTTGSLWVKLKPRVRHMRTQATPAEDILWEALRGRRLRGARFRRQHTISQFAVDFYCGEARLIVEADGPIHLIQQDADANRQAILENQGFKVLRFTNNQIQNQLDWVLSVIDSNLEAMNGLDRSELEGQ
jgi:very-short-patch-repair endonuclease